MSDNRKYYYLKLKENYFDDDSIVLLESMQDGVLYSNILLKLYLKSLKHGGRLQLDEDIPYTAQMIATITRQQIGTVERALQIFLKLGLVEVLDLSLIHILPHCGGCAGTLRVRNGRSIYERFQRKEVHDMNEKNTAQTQKEEREEVLKEIRQLENRKKILENKQRNEERRVRTRRLIERGAILEGIFPLASNLSGAEVKTFLIALSHLPGAAELTANLPKSGDTP